MKKLLKNLLLVAIAVGVTACSLDKLDIETTDGSEQKGYLQISSVSVNTDAEIAIIGKKTASATRATTSEADGDFVIEVINTKTTAVAWSGTYSQLKNGAAPVSIELEGRESYRVYAYQSSAKAPAADVVSDEPYYIGVSPEVSVMPNESVTTSVTCKMANVKASVELSADLKTSFKSVPAVDGVPQDGRLKTAVSVGAAAYTFEAEDTHQSKQKYYPVEDGDNTMNISLSGIYYTGRFEDVLNGQVDDTLWKEVTMNKSLQVRAAQWHKISVDIDHNTAGNAEFTFTIESYTYDEEIEVDVVSLAATLAVEETIVDDEIDLTAPKVVIDGRQDLNYTVNAAMINPDTEAWNTFLKLKVTPANGATLQRVWARLQESTNASLAAAMATKGFTDGVVNIYGPQDPALSTYSTVAADGTTITTKVAGMDALYKYRGTHTFRIYTLDDAGGGSKGYAGDLVITVSTDSGQGPSIVWMRDTDGNPDTPKEDVIDQTHTLIDASPYETELTITSDTGITSLFVKIESEPLTSNNNEALQLLGLSDEMDLLTPANAAMETGLRETGLLPKAEGAAASGDDDYRIYDPATGLRKKNADGSDKLSPFYGAKEVPFSVTAFTGTLWNFYNKDGVAVFTLTAGHDEGTTTKSVTFNIEK